jgi:hypothetical protein
MPEGQILQAPPGSMMHPMPHQPYTVIEDVGCGSVCKPVCRAVPDVKKVTKVSYDLKEDQICLPNCSGLPFGFNRNQCKPYCEDPCNATIRCKRVLLKSETTCEEPTCKYEVQHVMEHMPVHVCQEPTGKTWIMSSPVK